MKEALSLTLCAVACIMTTVGVFLIHVPSGFIVGGLMVLIFDFRLDKDREERSG